MYHCKLDSEQEDYRWKELINTGERNDTNDTKEETGSESSVCNMNPEERILVSSAAGNILFCIYLPLFIWMLCCVDCLFYSFYSWSVTFSKCPLKEISECVVLDSVAKMCF